MSGFEILHSLRVSKVNPAASGFDRGAPKLLMPAPPDRNR